MEALATKYRPNSYEEVSSQDSIIKILKQQTTQRTFVGCYLLCGPSGCGKTTIARIFGKEINQGKGTIIEIDGASNNGVDNVRAIIEDAYERSLDSEYKVYVVDEVHMITTQGWNAFLKCIEEPPKYTIFIFCTTDPQKIPATILNRVMRFNLSKVKTDDIEKRLEYICQQEGFTNYKESCDYISKISNGGMRDAIALLDKCSAFEKDLSIQNVLSALGSFSYDTYFDLTESLLNKDDRNVLGIIEYIYNSGNDLKLFIEQYLSFLLDLSKFSIFNTFKMIKIPEVYSQRVVNVTGFNDSKKYYTNLVDSVLEIKNQIRYDSNAKDTVEIMLLQQCK